MANEGKIIKFYVFDCPAHGVTVGSYCFRAYSGEYLDRWLVVCSPLRKPTEEELAGIKIRMGIENGLGTVHPHPGPAGVTKTLETKGETQ